MKSLVTGIKIICLILSISIIGNNLYAQTGIGTTTPNASAKLDVSATNKGFLPPRISLIDAYDQTTIPSPATGLLVYCKGDAGLAAGYYFWNGGAWATIATAGGSGSVVAEFGTQILSANVLINSATPIDVLSFTLPSAGTWEIISFLRAQGTAGYAGEFGIYDPSGILVPNSEILAAYGEVASTGTGVIRVTTTGAATYKLKAWSSSGAAYSFYATSELNGRTGVAWKKISGNAPVTGQSVDYVSVNRTSVQTVNTGDDIIFNTINSGNIPYNITTGNFSLTAGKTYRLTGSVSLDGTNAGVAEIDVAWKNAAGDIFGNKALILSTAFASNAAGNGLTDIIYTPTVNTTVALNVVYASSSAKTVPNYTYANIQQIGSSAIVNSWTLSGNNTYNTIGNIGMGTSSPDASSILDITSSSKGLLPPRVALTAKSGTTLPISSPATGLVVYNTATAGSTSDAVSPGYYYFNGTVWTRMNPEEWSTGVPITIGAVTTAPAKGTASIDYVKYRNVVGKEYEVEYNLVQTAAGSAGNGDYLITLPGGLQFDYTAQGQVAYTGAGGYNAVVARLVSANGDLYHSGAHNSATAVPYDATRLRIHTNNWGTVGWTFFNSSYYQLSAASAGFKMFFKFKAL